MGKTNKLYCIVVIRVTLGLIFILSGGGGWGGLSFSRVGFLGSCVT